MDSEEGGAGLDVPDDDFAPPLLTQVISRSGSTGVDEGKEGLSVHLSSEGGQEESSD